MRDERFLPNLTWHEIRDLENALHRQYPRMWMVGEVFERDAAQTAFFIGGRQGWDGIDTKLWHPRPG